MSRHVVTKRPDASCSSGCRAGPADLWDLELGVAEFEVVCVLDTDKEVLKLADGDVIGELETL